MTRRTRLLAELLEDRVTPAAPFAEFVDPNPSTGNQFGATVVALSTGNVVVTSPSDDAGGADAGAVYLFNGATGALISTLRGSTLGDTLGSGGVIALTNGNFVVRSPNWDNGAVVNTGAVTFGSGTTGVSGPVTAANSLVGTTANDRVGSSGVTALTNGNYVVRSQSWNKGAVSDAGAVTFGSGTTGVTGPVTATNSLVGSAAADEVGNAGVTALTNGNYVVRSTTWDNLGTADAGAVTFGSGTAGVTGPVFAANSLVGSSPNDQVGNVAVTPLTNGNYVVVSQNWGNGGVVNAGAVTFGSGTAGVSGPVSAANSLVGSAINDTVGSAGVTVLTNGNYVVVSQNWDNGLAVDAGAVTFGSGIAGVSGPVTAANSLVGSTFADTVGSGGVTALTNGNYVVSSESWDDGATLSIDSGAATFGSGTVGVSGPVSAANSLVGLTNDQIGSGGVTALTNGNYVVVSESWDDGFTLDVGAVTFGNGTARVTGLVTTANSLVGSTAADLVGAGGVVALSNGHYVVVSEDWDNGLVVDAGAVTFGSGTTGVSGPVTAANSLVGSAAGDAVGSSGVTALTNGNYVVRSPSWDNGAVTNAGAATIGSGTTGVTGPVTTTKSLVGSTAGDGVSNSGVTALTNGSYVVRSTSWDNGAVADAGAVTFGSGTAGVTGPVSAANSLVGSTANDAVGNGGVTALTYGNYAVRSASWDNGANTNAGAVTFGSGTAGASGPVNSLNSVFGLILNTNLQTVVVDDVNGTFFGRFRDEAGGRVRVGSQVSGLLPTVNLSVSATAGMEAGATVITVTATASAPVTGNQTVRLAVTGAGVTAGDFTLSSPTITILNGQTTGSVTFTVVDDAAAEGVETATLTISTPSANIALGATTSRDITLTSNDLALAAPLAVGGAAGTVAVFLPTGGPYATTPAAALAPFPGYAGVVRAAVADVDGDGVGDTVAVTGPGTPIRVAVLSGADNSTVLVAPFDPFGGNFAGGGYVAAADLDGDGRAEFVVTPDQGGGPRVSVFSRNADGTTSVRANFLGIDDANFRGGARAAVGDVNGDGRPDVIVAAGFGGGPRVSIFGGPSVVAGNPARFVNDFFAFPGADAERLRNGAFVAAADLTGDGRAELIFGGGPGGAPRVFILSGKRVSDGDAAGAQAEPVANFFVAGNSTDRGGVRLAARDLDGDGRPEVAAGSGAGNPARVRLYAGASFVSSAEPATFQDIIPFGGAVLADGVVVG